MLKILAMCFALLLTAAHARADDEIRYPSRLVRIVVPFPAGGPTDVYARIVADNLHKAWGQPVIVENVPGAVGAIGTRQVARAVPDGYTLLFTSNSAHVINPLIQEQAHFDSLKDFAPISMLLHYPFYLVVNNDLPARSVGELVALARANPGKFNFATFGPGSGTHLVAEMFKAQAGIDVVHVPYRGVAGMQQGLMTGDAHFMFDSIGSSKPLVDAGKFRALAVTGKQRSRAVPELPTLAEEGFSGFDARIWLGLFAPSGTSATIIAKLQRQVAQAVASPALHEQILHNGSEPVGSTPEFLADHIRDETPRWAEIIEKADLKIK